MSTAFIIPLVLVLGGVVLFLVVFWAMNIKKDRKARVRDHLLVEEITTWLKHRAEGKDNKES